MKTWVHRFAYEEGYDFVTNSEFLDGVNNGTYKEKKVSWIPYKVEIPDIWEPIELEDGSITLKSPMDASERVKLMDILVSDSEGRPCLLLSQDRGPDEELLLLEEVLY